MKRKTIILTSFALMFSVSMSAQATTSKADALLNFNLARP